MIDKEKAKCLVKLKLNLSELDDKYWIEYKKWVNKNDCHSDNYYKAMNKFIVPIQEIYDTFQKLGFKFGCEDHGDKFCLDMLGLIHALEIIFDISEEDLKC